MKKVFWVIGVLLPLLLGGLLFAKSISEIMNQIDRYRTLQEEEFMKIRSYYFLWQQGYIGQGKFKITLTPALKDSVKQDIKDCIQALRADMDSCKMWVDSLACKIK